MVASTQEPAGGRLNRVLRAWTADARRVEARQARESGRPVSETLDTIAHGGRLCRPWAIGAGVVGDGRIVALDDLARRATGRRATDDRWVANEADWTSSSSTQVVGWPITLVVRGRLVMPTTKCRARPWANRCASSKRSPGRGATPDVRLSGGSAAGR
jgi:hypothetical protein